MVQDNTNQADTDAIAKLMDKHGNLTPQYKAYLQYENAHKSKVKARDKAHASALTDPMKLQQWPLDGATFQDDVDQSWDRWMGLGFKLEIEKALSTLSARGNAPVMTLIDRAKKKFQRSLYQPSDKDS